MIKAFERLNAKAVYDATPKTSDIPFKAKGSKKEKKRIAKLVKMLAKSPTARKTLEASHKAGYSISLVSGIDSLGFCDIDDKTITLNASFSNDKNVATLVHEARHAVQFDNGVDFALDRNNIKSFLMLMHTTEADAEANAGMAAWELKELGIAKPWKHFISDAPFVSKAIEKSINKNGLETIDAKKEVLTDAFESWHNDSFIRETYDKGYVDELEMYEEEGLAEEFKFDKNATAKEIVSMVCHNDGDMYYKKNSKEIETDNFLSISKEVKDSLSNLMERRKKAGLNTDKSLSEIPVSITQNFYSINNFSIPKKTSFALNSFLINKKGR